MQRFTSAHNRDNGKNVALFLHAGTGTVKSGRLPQPVAGFEAQAL
jgi:hypothetical protein